MGQKWIPAERGQIPKYCEGPVCSSPFPESSIACKRKPRPHGDPLFTGMYLQASQVIFPFNCSTSVEFEGSYMVITIMTYPVIDDYLLRVSLSLPNHPCSSLIPGACTCLAHSVHPLNIC